MINETLINATINSSLTCSLKSGFAEMSPLSQFAMVIATGTIDLLKNNNTILVFAALFGALTFISVLGQNMTKAFQYIFYIIFAVPLIISFGLLNKKERSDRLKELGDIKAHLKENPDITKKFLFVVCVAIFIIILLGVSFYVQYRIVGGIYAYGAIEQAKGQALLNGSNIT